MARRIRAAGTALLLVSLLARPAAQEPATPRTISIAMPDGGAIQADVYGGGPRGVLLLHGGRFDRSSWRPQATVLAAAGFRVVAIDFRRPADARAGRDAGCGYDAVCLATYAHTAVRYLRDHGVTSVAIVGASLGGGAAAQAAIEAAPGQIDRVVLLAHMLVDAPERLRVPALFIVARDDANTDGPRLPGIRAQYERAAGPKELVLLDGDAHAQAIFGTPQGDRLLREILQFVSR